jgi:hypothetical protein
MIALCNRPARRLSFAQTESHGISLAKPSSTLEEGVPMDAVLLLATLAFFALALAYAWGCTHV